MEALKITQENWELLGAMVEELKELSLIGRLRVITSAEYAPALECIRHVLESPLAVVETEVTNWTIAVSTIPGGTLEGHPILIDEGSSDEQLIAAERSQNETKSSSSSSAESPLPPPVKRRRLDQA